MQSFCHAAGWYLWQCGVRWILGKKHLCLDFFFSFFKGCVVVCHPSVSVELHLSLCGLFRYLEGTVVQCRRWKPCDSSRICVAVVNPSPSPPFFFPLICRHKCHSVHFAASIIFYWKCDGHFIVWGELLYVVFCNKALRIMHHVFACFYAHSDWSVCKSGWYSPVPFFSQMFMCTLLLYILCAMRVKFVLLEPAT